MSGPNILANAHDIAISGGTFYAADTVSGTIHINNSNRTTSDGVIPLMPNPSNRFTGRTEVTAKLKSHFFTNTIDSAQNRKFFLLYGMGGIGKTQICLKFVEEMYDSFSQVFWVDASFLGTILQALKVDWLSE
ncbi:hypothetical protein K443DRAFT_675499 [Laccaria amethystina LaAM-08-1]|uniref:NB-ARC domain-containing protein n=1 Tax=Laccaria amethystina LaAM-08-1 TaxID=1095629 RepID=A0A0C9Y4L4_9AGAR|nr:hypothetical protein K443DRAFT_675499 [Laccaria amethystina LaAM-08-1]